MDLRIENAQTSAQFVEMFKALGVALPLCIGGTGSIEDAEGNDLALIDPVELRGSNEQEKIALLFILAVNTCAGFRAERTAP